MLYLLLSLLVDDNLDLESADYRVRVAAEKRMYENGYVSCMVGLASDRLEVRLRSERVLKKLHNRSRIMTVIKIEDHFKSNYPCLDMAWFNGKSYDTHIGNKLVNYVIVDKDYKDYFNFRKATRDVFIDLHSVGIPISVLDSFSTEMHRREKIYFRLQPRPVDYSPPQIDYPWP